MNRPHSQNDAGDRAGRLFLAVGLTDEVRRGLEAHLREQLGSRGLPGRAVVPANWHFTLRFLGDTSRAEAERLREELRAAVRGGSFTLSFGGLGAFPKPRRASVLWIGVDEGADALRSLAAGVEAAAVRAGFTREEKPFRAHLTLARLQPPADVTPVIESVAPFDGRLAVDSVILYRSHLGGGPPRYDAVERFPLGGEDG